MVKMDGHKLRRMVFWLVLLSGISMLTCLFLYYSGYRFDWSQRRLIQLGSIVVDIIPEGSFVFLNGEQLSKTTPAIFNSIHPGEYTLRIEYAGYAPLEFPITVRSKSATVVTDVFLPLLVPPVLIPKPEFKQVAVSEKQLVAVQLIQDWPIWKIVGTDPIALISGPKRQLNLVDGKDVVVLDEQVTDVEANAELNQLVFSKTGTAWMVFTNFDPIHLFILSRQTAPFKDILLIPNTHSVILSDQQLIQLVQIGPSESLALYQLASGDDIQSIQLDQSEKILYFQDGEQWYQLELIK